MEPLTRAGKLMQERGFWFQEFEKREHDSNVCKTVMFKRKDGVRIAALVPLSSRVSYKKLKAHYAMDVAPLSPDEMRQEGFEPGEAAPMLVQCELLVDPVCERIEPMHTGSGTLGYGIEWHFADLKNIRDYIVLDVQEKR